LLNEESNQGQSKGRGEKKKRGTGRDFAGRGRGNLIAPPRTEGGREVKRTQATGRRNGFIQSKESEVWQEIEKGVEYSHGHNEKEKKMLGKKSIPERVWVKKRTSEGTGKEKQR